MTTKKNTDYQTHAPIDSTLSHQNTRLFQPDKLTAPRDTNRSELARCTTGRPLVLEIGAGKGMHAIQYVAAHPTQQIIAIERTKNKFLAFTKRIAELNASETQHKNTNDELSPQVNKPSVPLLAKLLAVHADAIPFIVHYIKPSSVDMVFILYPNPEPHNSNQQWLNMPFFEFLLSRLNDDGHIIMASNIETYIDNAEQQAQNLWQVPCVRSQVPQDSARTHFEVKYLARRETCWQLEMTKPKGYRTRFDTWQKSR